MTKLGPVSAETVSRTTCRRIVLCVDPAVRIPLSNATTRQTEFRASTVDETWEQHEDGSTCYRVKVRGPVVTLAGRDHASNSGLERWEDWPPVPVWGTEADLLDSIAALLWGPDQLAGWTGLVTEGPS